MRRILWWEEERPPRKRYFVVQTSAIGGPLLLVRVAAPQLDLGGSARQRAACPRARGARGVRAERAMTPVCADSHSPHRPRAGSLASSSVLQNSPAFPTDLPSARVHMVHQAPGGHGCLGKGATGRNLGTYPRCRTATYEPPDGVIAWPRSLIRRRLRGGRVFFEHELGALTPACECNSRCERLT